MPKLKKTSEEIKNINLLKRDKLIGVKISSVLSYTGMTKEELALKLGITKSTLYKRFSDPSAMTLKELRCLDELLNECELGPILNERI